MKKPSFGKILYILGITAVAACIIFETAAVLHGEKGGTSLPVYADENDVYAISDDETKLLAEFVSAEVGDKPFICKVAVAAVIFNRMRSSEYPSSLSDVIFQAGAFDSTSDGRLDSEVNPKKLSSAMNAVTAAKQGEDPTGGALRYFRDGDKSADSASVLFNIEDMTFTD